MVAAVLLVVAGLAGLFQGGNALVGGSSGIARQLGVSPLVVGLTIVAFATSAPELAVSVTAAMRGSTDIAVGNVLGSNIFNTLVAVGAVAAIRPLRVHPIVFRQEIWICLAATGAVGLAGWTGGVIERWEGGVLLGLLAAYLLRTVLMARSQQHEAEEDNEAVERNLFSAALGVVAALAAYGLHSDFVSAVGGDAESLGLLDRVRECGAVDHLGLPALAVLTLLNALLYARKPSVWVRVVAIVLGLSMLIMGSEALVEGATTLAYAAGISEGTVGLTVVAVGTSAPELATGILAARRGQSDIGVGNALGSNIFNLLAVLGIAALILPLPVADHFLNQDIWVAVAAVLVLLVARLNQGVVGRPLGVLMALSWVAYTAWLVIEETGSAAS